MAVIHDRDPWGDTEAPRRRYGWFWLLLVLGVAGGIGYYVWNRDTSFPDVTADSGRLTTEADEKETLTVVDRRTGPEVWFRVVLRNAPVGAVLPLKVEWIDPSGKVYHRNRYETKPVALSDWPTHARCRIRADAPAGPWRVELSLQGRLLHQQSFEVRDRVAEE